MYLLRNEINFGFENVQSQFVVLGADCGCPQESVCVGVSMDV
jgi:hypothetical protein